MPGESGNQRPDFCLIARVACVLGRPPSRRLQRWSDFAGAEAAGVGWPKGDP